MTKSRRLKTPTNKYATYTDSDLHLIATQGGSNDEARLAARAEFERRAAQRATDRADTQRRETAALDVTILEIARRFCRQDLDTLSMRNSDRLDFIEVSRAGLADALRAAYAAGRAAK